jgi:WD40 repeat protein
MGETRSWADYQAEFPELSGKDGAASDLVAAATPLLGGSTLRVGEKLPPGSAGQPGHLPDFPDIPGYEVIEQVGLGGMGAVYKTRQTRLKRLVALKVVSPGFHADPAHLARFRAEAEAVARLQHPNIVQIYEVGDYQGLPYLALEFVDGGNLAESLIGKPQLPRPAAYLVETLARAVQFAHEFGIIHRDLKPANILLRAKGKGEWTKKQEETDAEDPLSPSLFALCPLITDFGLAKQLGEEGGKTISGAIMGTPDYMAPEQAEGKSKEVGPAADIFALGAILYELLTGRPPFQGANLLDTLEQVRTREPVPPAALQPKIPRDLETICLKALAKAPARRYPHAGDLADDLRRFLVGEPIRARPVGLGERLVRWCRRYPARAGLVATGVALVLTIVVASLLVAWASTARERDRRREAILGQLQLVRLSSRTCGWSEEAWKLVAEAAQISMNGGLRNQAAAACAGLDARPVRHLEKLGVPFLTFDGRGERLLLGGADNARGQPLEGAKLWERTTGTLQISRQAGAGPVAFDARGRPLQLVPQTGPRLRLWDVAKNEAVRELHYGPGVGASFVPARNELGAPLVVLSPDASRAAGALVGPDGQGLITGWETETGRLLFQLAGTATALALSPSGKWLAVSNREAEIALVSLTESKRVTTLRGERALIHCLAFSHDERRLAVGDGAGTVTIWDIAGRVPVTYCYGSHHDVYALSFGPDGTILASGGRGPPRLWDATTGRLLLGLKNGGLVTGLVFSPDGGNLVVAEKSPSRVSIWTLESGRGIQTLRGLASQASHLCFSEDGRLLAALGHNWEVAIWDVAAGQLRFLLDLPRGGAEDDAALAFSPDGSQFACAAGEGAKLWAMATGKQLVSWRLPPGAKDVLAFHRSGGLLLFRVETGNGPNSISRDRAMPIRTRVCRIRNLLGPRSTTPLAEITEFNRHFFDSEVVPDGSFFLAEGIHEGPDGRRRTVRAFDGLTGTERWSMPSTKAALSSGLVLDPKGKVLAVCADNRQQGGSLIEVSSGQRLGELDRLPISIGPGADVLVQFGPQDPSGQERGYALYRRGDSNPLLVLGLDSTPFFRPVFNRAGTLLAWSNSDGTVSVCQLEPLRGRLANLGLGW